MGIQDNSTTKGILFALDDLSISSLNDDHKVLSLHFRELLRIQTRSRAFRNFYRISALLKLLICTTHVTCVPLETGLRMAPAPATFALALAMDGRRDPNAEAER